MSSPAHPRTMQPRHSGPTRTLPARRPDQFWTGGRYRSYILFGATGFVFLLMGLLVLRMVWALGDGPEAWQAVQKGFSHPVYLAWHGLALVWLLWFAVRFNGMFGKTQPPRIGPLRPPPPVFFTVALNTALLGATALVVAILWGILL